MLLDTCSVITNTTIEVKIGQDIMSLVCVSIVDGAPIFHVTKPLAQINLDLAGIDTSIKCKIATTMSFILITFLFLNENKQ